MKNKFVALDGIRGIAALFILTRHSAGYWTIYPFHSYAAVDIFFLLSGFVIAHSYEEKLASGALSTRDFIVTRIIRLYPMYLLAAVVAIAFMLATLTGQEPAWQAPLRALSAVLMIPNLNLHDAALFPLLGVTWSLFFELIVNLLYVLLRRWLTSGVLVAVIVACAAVVVAIGLRRQDLDFGWQGTPGSVIGGLSRASFGILLGVLLYRHREPIWRTLPRGLGPYAATAILCGFLSFPSIGRLNPVIDLTAILVVVPICVMAAARETPTYGVKLMTILGVASYPLYLLHPLVIAVLDEWPPFALRSHAPYSGAAFMLFMVAFAVGLERYVDLPIRRALGRRFLPAKPQPQATPPVAKSSSAA